MNWELISSYEYLIDVGIAIGIFLLFLLFRKIFTKYVFSFLLKLSRKTRSNFLPNIFLAFDKPFQWFFIIIGLYLSVKYYPYLNHLNPLFIKIIKAAIIYIISWGFFNLASTSSMIFRSINEKTNIKIDEILIPFLSRAIQFIIIAISVTVILQVFDYEIGALITGLGIGGLAISLAAQDALKNLFGGIVIITEKPFTIGEWVKTPSVEGTVEDISFRSTKVRTFAQALVTVPNATLVNEPITNWSKMGKRQITFNLSLTYDTPKEKIELVVQSIRELLKNHPEIHQETIFVTVDEYDEYGLDILLYFFTKTTEWGKYLEVREEINLKILGIVEQAGAEIAIPAQKLYSDAPNEDILKRVRGEAE
ncbi:mechanosensitive ion channel family protein [Pseudogracilibacillus sp. SO30301A]|uniref:mechanosensitive ion channel family protein n=1 Tax=Pseudogracilibacillus sp. SO30301A TaxID=3098291 RepID=UPI00300DBE91